MRKLKAIAIHEIHLGGHDKPIAPGKPFSDAKSVVQPLIDEGAAILAGTDEDVLDALVNEHGLPIDVDDGDPDEADELDLTDEQRARLPQLDHDGDGEPGGSTSGGSDDELQAARDEYRTKLGKNFFPGWGVDELRKRIAEYEASQHTDGDGDGEPGGSEEESGDDDAGGEDAAGDEAPPA